MRLNSATTQKVAAGVAVGVVVGLAVPGFCRFGKTLSESLRPSETANAMPSHSAVPSASAVSEEVVPMKICVTGGDVRLTNPRGEEWVSESSVPAVISMDSQCVLSKTCPTGSGQDLNIVVPITVTSLDSKRKPQPASKSVSPKQVVLDNTTIVADPECVQSELLLNGALNHAQKGQLFTITTDVDPSCFLQLLCRYDGGSYSALLRPKRKATGETPSEMVVDETDTTRKK